jgi:hypothetical protein
MDLVYNYIATYKDEYIQAVLLYSCMNKLIY